VEQLAHKDESIRLNNMTKRRSLFETMNSTTSNGWLGGGEDGHGQWVRRSLRAARSRAGADVSQARCDPDGGDVQFPTSDIGQMLEISVDTSPPGTVIASTRTSGVSLGPTIQQGTRSPTPGARNRR
jgi:hypothetical protein